jgi:hypothetical protein
MKSLKVAALALLLLVSISCLSLKEGKAKSTMQITSVTLVDFWGNVNFIVDRGLETRAMIILSSPCNESFLISASLFDTSSTPVGYAMENFLLANGNNTITLRFNVSSYAFIGVGHLNVVISDLNRVPIASFDLTVYIDVLGDFNKDNVVNFEDLAYFENGYAYYRCNYTVPSEYKSCDITLDEKVDFDDLLGFATGYATYWTHTE